jgi:type III pantothenate kinase
MWSAEPGRFAGKPSASKGKVRPVLLAVDVGNTNVTLALFDGEKLVADWRVTSHRERTGDEIGVELTQLFGLRGFELKVVSGVVISSVVPTLNPALVDASRRYLKCEPVMVGPGVKTSVRIRYENPRDVGADRIANALAAYTKYGGPIVVIDFGTAVTYDAINKEGDYLGGAIAPGVEISLDALVSQTAMLRRVEPVAPDSVIGRNTIASIQSGLIWGFVAQVEGMVKRMVDELGGNARVVATGGQAALVAGLTNVIETTDPLLTLEGLRLIYSQNSDGGART